MLVNGFKQTYNFTGTPLPLIMEHIKMVNEIVACIFCYKVVERMMQNNLDTEFETQARKEEET